MTDEQTHDPFRPRTAVVGDATPVDAPDFAGPVRADVTDLAKAYDQDVPTWLLLSPELLQGTVERGDAVALIDGDSVSEWLVIAVDPEVVVIGEADDQATIDDLAGDDSDEDATTQAVGAQDGEPGDEGTDGAGEAQGPIYTPEDVPTTAAEVVAWIGEGADDGDTHARARVAWRREQADHGDSPRKTVQAAVSPLVRDVAMPD